MKLRVVTKNGECLGLMAEIQHRGPFAKVIIPPDLKPCEGSVPSFTNELDIFVVERKCNFYIVEAGDIEKIRAYLTYDEEKKPIQVTAIYKAGSNISEPIKASDYGFDSFPIDRAMIVTSVFKD